MAGLGQGTGSPVALDVSLPGPAALVAAAQSAESAAPGTSSGTVTTGSDASGGDAAGAPAARAGQHSLCCNDSTEAGGDTVASTSAAQASAHGPSITKGGSSSEGKGAAGPAAAGVLLPGSRTWVLCLLQTFRSRKHAKATPAQLQGLLSALEVLCVPGDWGEGRRRCMRST